MKTRRTFEKYFCVQPRTYLCAVFYYFFRMVSLLLLLVASVTLIATMPRLGKQRQHLQRIAESRRAANQTASAEQTTHDELLDSSNDDDEHDYILVEDEVVDDDELQSVFEKTIQWKEGAGQQFC